MNILFKLMKKRFSVYVDGEFERFTSYLGVFKLLANYSDFTRLTDKEMTDAVKEWSEIGSIYIDANITVTFKIDVSHQCPHCKVDLVVLRQKAKENIECDCGNKIKKSSVCYLDITDSEEHTSDTLCSHCIHSPFIGPDNEYAYYRVVKHWHDE